MNQQDNNDCPSLICSLVTWDTAVVKVAQILASQDPNETLTAKRVDLPPAYSLSIVYEGPHQGQHPTRRPTSLPDLRRRREEVRSLDMVRGLGGADSCPKGAVVALCPSV